MQTSILPETSPGPVSAAAATGNSTSAPTAAAAAFAADLRHHQQIQAAVAERTRLLHAAAAGAPSAFLSQLHTNEAELYPLPEDLRQQPQGPINGFPAGFDALRIKGEAAAAAAAAAAHLQQQKVPPTFNAAVLKAADSKGKIFLFFFVVP